MQILGIPCEMRSVITYIIGLNFFRKSGKSFDGGAMSSKLLLFIKLYHDISNICYYCQAMQTKKVFS